MEEWKAVPGYEGQYEVSSEGRVRSVPRQVRHYGGVASKQGKVLKATLSPHGYYYVNLSSQGVVVHRKIHRLVALAFLPNPNSLPFVNHLDHTRTNNQVSNLEWCTAKQNMEHAARDGKFKEYGPARQGGRGSAKRLPYSTISEIVRLASEGNHSRMQIASKLGVTSRTVWKYTKGTPGLPRLRRARRTIAS